MQTQNLFNCSSPKVSLAKSSEVADLHEKVFPFIHDELDVRRSGNLYEFGGVRHKHNSIS